MNTDDKALYEKCFHSCCRCWESKNSLQLIKQYMGMLEMVSGTILPPESIESVMTVDTKPKKAEVLDLDAILDSLGGLNRFQVIVLLQILVIVTCSSLTDLSYVFSAGKLNHRCLIRECENETSTFSQPWLSAAIPEMENGELDLCKRYASVDYSTGQCSSNEFTKEILNCDDFKYETTEWTIEREDWGIRCKSDRWMLNLIGSLSNTGAVVGTLFVGYFGDRFGRKIVILSLCAIVSVVGVIKSFAVNYAMFATLEFVLTAFTGGLFSLPFILALEMVSPAKRLIAGCVMSCAYPLGEIIVPLVQWGTLNWRTSLRIMYAPYILTSMSYWGLPESPRWLLAKNKREDVVNVLKRIARVNGTTLSAEAVNQVMSYEGESQDEKKAQAVWKSKIILFRYGKILFLWVVTLFTFFGMNLSSVSISSNKFLDSTLACLVEIPGCFLASWFMAQPLFGRRYTLSGSFFICAMGCLVFAYIPGELYWPKLIVFLMGKFGITIATMCMNVYTTELFPTTVRGTAGATGHMVGRIASILAPQTPLLQVYYVPIPLLFFSTLAGIASMLTLTLPETLNTKLPDTVKDAENLGHEKLNDVRKTSRA